MEKLISKTQLDDLLGYFYWSIHNGVNVENILASLINDLEGFKNEPDKYAPISKGYSQYLKEREIK